MCLGLPMKLLKKEGNTGLAEVGGVTRGVRLDLVPFVRVGDYIIVHAGYAIQVLDEEQYRETIELIERLVQAS